MLKKPSQLSMTTAGVGAAAAIGGAMGSKGLFGLVHDSSKFSDPKKEKNSAMLKHAGLVVMGILVTASAQGKDTASTAVKAAGVGVAVAQGSELVKLAFQDSAELVNPTSKAKKFLADSVGLGCNCSQGLNAPKRRYPRLRASNVTIEQIAPSLPALAANNDFVIGSL